LGKKEGLFELLIFSLRHVGMTTVDRSIALWNVSLLTSDKKK
jgi:hypothetical protein